MRQTRKRQSLNLRIKAEERGLIDRAAKTLGKIAPDEPWSSTAFLNQLPRRQTIGMHSSTAYLRDKLLQSGSSSRRCCGSHGSCCKTSSDAITEFQRGDARRS